MSDEQRTAIKFCVLNGKNRKEAMEMLVKAYGDAAPKRTALHKCYSRYDNGYESVMVEQRSGRPASLTSQKVQEIKELLDKDKRIMVREVSQRVDCSVGTVHTIIHENLNLRRLCARWIPKMLSKCQKAQRVESCRRFVQRFEREGEDFLSRNGPQMIRGSIYTNWNQKNSLQCGKFQGLHHPRNLKSVVQRRNRCSSCSSTSKASSLAMPFCKNRRSQQITTQR